MSATNPIEALAANMRNARDKGETLQRLGEIALRYFKFGQQPPIIPYESAVFDLVSQHQTSSGLELIRSRFTYYGTPQSSVSTWMGPVSSDPTIRAVIEERRVVSYPDLDVNRPSTWGGRTRHLKSWIALPLFFNEAVLGIILFDHSTNGAFASVNLELVDACGKIIAGEIAEALSSRNHNAYEKASDILLDDDLASPQETLHEAARFCRHTLECLQCRFYLRSPDGNYVTVADNLGFGEQRRTHHAGQGIFEWVTSNKQVRSIPSTNDRSRASDFVQFPGVASDVQSMVVAPIISKDTVIGVLSVDSDKNYFFSRRDCQLIEQIARLAARQMSLLRKQQQADSPSKVFIIYGHDVKNMRKLEEVLRNLKLEPIILSEIAMAGETWIEPFEREASGCRLAFALITPDNIITKITDGNQQAVTQPEYFARPNVILETGWFYGRHGRHSVIMLWKEGTRLPSDLESIIRVPFKEEVDEVDTVERLKRELAMRGFLTATIRLPREG